MEESEFIEYANVLRLQVARRFLQQLSANLLIGRQYDRQHLQVR